MKRETISAALNGLDERFITEAASYSPGGIQERPERIIAMKKKRLISAALAACSRFGHHGIRGMERP